MDMSLTLMDSFLMPNDLSSGSPMDLFLTRMDLFLTQSGTFTAWLMDLLPNA